jgi:Zn-dependent protease with chaperone function
MLLSGVAVPAAIQVQPWPAERPLFVVNLLAALALWVVAIVSIVGLLYGIMLGVFFFVMHLGLVAHVRGSGVRLGPEQLPEIHAAVERLSAQIGLKKVPETYVLQGGGVLNAFATRFIGADMVVLFSDLIEACGDDTGARDMIIAHELGHIHRGHVRWHLVLLPAMLVPFLGTALSRAREYTCDRYGAAGSGDREASVLGLSILAAGGALGRRVNRQALVTQRSSFETGWMTIGEWLSTHPPLVKRIAQIDPTLAAPGAPSPRGVLRALVILGAIFAPLVVAGAGAALVAPRWLAAAAAAQQRAQTQAGAEEDEEEYQAPPTDVATSRARGDLARLSAFINVEVAAGRRVPWDTRDLYGRFKAANPAVPEPLDPFDGTRYGYDQRASEFFIWSVGPDLESWTADDLTYDSRAAR